MTLISRTGSLFVPIAIAALAACGSAEESAAAVDATESAQTPTSGALPAGQEPAAQPASNERPAPAAADPLSSVVHGPAGVCSADLYPAESTGYVCGALEFGALAPVDAYAYVFNGGGGNGGSQWVYDGLAIVFSETRNECAFNHRGVSPSKRNRLTVELTTQSGNLLDPNAYHKADPITAGTYVNAGKRNVGPGQIYEVRFRAESGEGCTETEQGVTYGPGHGQSVDSYATGTVTIKERTTTSVSGVIDVADMLGHWAKIEFTAPICGPWKLPAEPKCCAPGQSG